MLTSDILNNTLSKLRCVNTLWVGYSGGVDSHALLHLVATSNVKTAYLTKVIHVNHGISVHAHEWEAHCKNVCETLGLELITVRSTVEKDKGDSLEAKARECRYGAFESVFEKNDVMLTAHHQDDQAETLLLQLFRGAGPKGLSSMPSIRALAGGHLVRPLLNVTRDDIERYAQYHKLQYIVDDSNKDTTFDRNYIRHQVMPMIKDRWPSAAKALKRSYFV